LTGYLENGWTARKFTEPLMLFGRTELSAGRHEAVVIDWL